MNDIDLERALSDALQTITPEPPTAYRFTSSTQPAGTSGLVAVVVLDDVRRRRRPYGALLAAAAVVVLGGDIAFAAIAGNHSDRNTTPAAPDRSVVPAEPTCASSDDIVVSLAGRTISAAQVTVRLQLQNTGPRTCTLGAEPVLSIDRGVRTPSGGFLGAGFVIRELSTADLVLGPDDRLVYALTMDSTGTCRDAGTKASPGITVDRGIAFTVTSSLGITGCTVRPSGASVRVLR